MSTGLPHVAEKMGEQLRAEVTRQLLLDLAHFRQPVPDELLSIDWSDACQEGHCTRHLSGELEDMSSVAVRGTDGQVVAEGWIDFVHGGPQHPLYVFWLFLRVREGGAWRSVKDDLAIPQHIWNGLPESSRDACSVEGIYDVRWKDDPKVVAWRHERAGVLPEHVCWWSRRYESELADDGTRAIGAGLPHAVLVRAAAALGTELTTRPSEADEHGEDIAMGTFASGSTHDDCFFELHPTSPELKRALLLATLELHEEYLGIAVDWSAVLPAILERFASGMSLRMRSDPRRGKLAFRAYPRESSFLRRRFAKTVVVDCVGGVGRLGNV
jgi:hypothetical protein